MIHHKFLLWAILIGAIIGIFCGWYFGHAMESIGWLGQLFLNALKIIENIKQPTAQETAALESGN